MRTAFGAALGVVLLALSAVTATAGGAREGAFEGASGHVTTGAVEVVETDEGWEIHLKDNFAFDGAPDPRVGFGKGGAFASGSDFAALQANSGHQVYKVPASLDPSDFDTVFIWCRQFSVPLGLAAID